MHLRISLLLLLMAAQAGAFDQLSDWQKRVLVYAAPGVESLETAFDWEIGLRQYGDTIFIERWAVPGIPKPSEADLPSLEDALQILADYEAVREIARQEAKPLEQKTAENAFFTLTETILTFVSDERAGQTPPIKLSFSEINGLIKTIQATDPMAAINFSLELLAVDAELKRFDVLWWDKAATHIIQE